MTSEQVTQQVDVVVGARVHALMWARRINQRQVAAALGVAQPGVSRRLRGETSINVRELFVLADLLGVDVVDLVNETGPETVQVTVSGPALLLPRLDSNQQPSGYQSAQVRAWAYWRASRAASGASLVVAS